MPTPSILKKYESAQWQPIETGGEFYLEAIHNLNTFREAAYDIAEKNNRRIDEEMPFSRMIQERIEEFYPNQTTESELLKKIKQSGNVFANSQAAITRIDSTFREELEREFLRNIVTATAEATEKEEQNIYQEIIEKFLEIMGMPADSPYKDELTDSVRDMFILCNGVVECVGFQLGGVSFSDFQISCAVNLIAKDKSLVA